MKTNNNGHEPLKLIGLQINGFRKLNAIDMSFKLNGLTQIKGDNEMGKTSIINSIEWLIRGNRVLNRNIKNPDAEKIEGRLILGDYEIKRTRGKSDQLQVKNLSDGSPVKGEVQNFLDTLINELTLNPQPFLNKTEVQKYQFLMELLKDKIKELSLEIAGMEFSEIDKKLETFETDRTLTGREVKKYGDIELPEKVEKVDITALSEERKKLEKLNEDLLAKYEEAKQKELDEIGSFNKEQREKTAAIESTEKSIKDYEDKLIEDQADIDRLKKELFDAETKWNGHNNSLNKEKIDLANLPKAEPEKPLVATAKKPELNSTDAIDKKIQDAGAINEKAAAYQTALDKKAEKAEKQKEYEAFTDKIEALRNKKFDILKKTDTGVKGLEIREDGIYYKDISSENWSDSESLRISCELCIAQSPKLRTIFLDRAESMGTKALKDFGDWAEKNDIQAIVTRVDDVVPDEIPDGTFFIEEGRLIKGIKEAEA